MEIGITIFHDGGEPSSTQYATRLGPPHLWKFVDIEEQYEKQKGKEVTMFERFRYAKDFREKYNTSIEYAWKRTVYISQMQNGKISIEQFYEKIKDLNRALPEDLGCVQAKMRETQAPTYDKYNVSAEFKAAKIELGVRYRSGELSDDEFTAEFKRINEQYPEDWAAIQTEFAERQEKSC